MRGKCEQTHTLNFLSVFSCCSDVLVHWFFLHRFASCVRLFFGTHSKMQLVNFCLSLHLRGWYSADCLYLFSFSSQHPFQIELSPSFRLVSAGRTSFSLVPYLGRKFWTSSFFESSSANTIIHMWQVDPRSALLIGSLSEVSCLLP